MNPTEWFKFQLFLIENPPPESIRREFYRALAEMLGPPPIPSGLESRSEHPAKHEQTP